MSRRLAVLVPLSVAAALVAVPTTATGGPVGATCLGDPVTQAPGTSAGEIINGTDGNDVIVAGGGADTVHGFDGDDKICLGAGMDAGYGEGGNDRIVAGKGPLDTLNGGDDADTLIGGPHEDLLYGDAGTDVLKGKAGPDQLGPGPDVDRANGGKGTDTATYFFAAAGVRIHMGRDVATGEGKDTLVAIEKASGSQFNDTLLGGSGVDFLDGFWGNDTIHGSGGRDVMTGNLGFDTLDLTDAPRGVEVDLLDETATGHGTDVVQTFEVVLGSRFADRLTGAVDGDRLHGQGGRDRLSGAGGGDFLYGEGGADDLDGGAGDDVCVGGPGTDSGSRCETQTSIP